MIALLSPLVWWIRRCQTRRASVSLIEKLLRAALLLPAFGLIFVLLRLRLHFFGPLTLNVTTLDGGKFTCHPPDLIQMYLWLFGVWEPDLTHYIRKNLKPGDIFVDVGANIGYDTVLAAQRLSDTALAAVAIEASPAVFTHLQQTILQNNLGHCVRLINKAASSEPGEITVYAGPQHNTGLTTTVPQRGLNVSTSQQKIEALPLDDLLTDEEISRVRLIKIDVEGAEPEVLAGMNRFLKSTKGEPAQDVEILIELSPLWWRDDALRPIDVLQPFLDAGFHIYEMENNYWPWRYLWPNAIAPINRCTRDLTQRVKRIDLILSRRNVDQL